MKSPVPAHRVGHMAGSAFLLCCLLGLLVLACKWREPANTPRASTSGERASCPTTKAVWAKPPEDSAIPDPPTYGHYFVNADRSIWASAWWHEEPELLRAGGDGVKVGWFRPEGTTLQVVGHRLDAAAPPLVARIPCCYPERFQASGLVFPTAGCWKVNANAAGSSLSFVVRVREVAQQSRSGA